MPASFPPPVTLLGESPRQVLTVSQLTVLVRERLEQGFPDIWVEGEVSNLRMPSSGHLYLTLKDELSQVRAVVFRAIAQRLRFEPREGLHLLVRGRLTVYEPRGDYQLILDYLEPKGVGALQIRFEQLKERLAREGLFDESRKRPIPSLPRRVGIVTSLTGAALQDMLTVLRRRCPILGVLVCPVPVQGEEAAPVIAEAIRSLSRSGDVEVLIVGRGGGSWEDLWCFNEEIVARAIVESPIPVVSGVGHETDFTLADFVADYRAPTPSAAAEAVAPVLSDLARGLLDAWLRQERALQRRIALWRERLRNLSSRFPYVQVRVQRHAQLLDDLVARLVGSFRQALLESRQAVLLHRHALGAWNPLIRVRSRALLVQQLMTRAEKQMVSLLTLKRQMVGTRVAKLDSLSPLSILARGYSILRKVSEGTVVRSADDVTVGEDIHARLGKGQLRCQVREILDDP